MKLILYILIYFFCNSLFSQNQVRRESSLYEKLEIQELLQEICDLNTIDSKLINQIAKEKVALIDSIKGDSVLYKLRELEFDFKINKAKFELAKEILKLRKSELDGSYLLNFKGVKYQIFIPNNKNLEVAFHHKDKKGKKYNSIKRLKDDLQSQSKEVLFITNGGMYTPESDPEGLFVENYKTLFSLDTGSSEIFLNFYLHPNGVYYIDKFGKPQICATKKYVEMMKDTLFQPKFATQSGPMLRIDSKMHPKFNETSVSKKLRSGIGVYEGLSVFAITRGVSNFYDFSSFYDIVFSCENALFLDGVISQAYDPKLSPNDLGGNFGPLISITSEPKD